MSNLKLDDVILAEDYLIIVPGRSNADIVRTEKKYDRHFMGTVIKANCEVCQNREEIINEKGETVNVVYKGIKAEPGDVVFYDDSDAVETSLEYENGEKTNVEFIYNASVVGIVKGDKVNG